MLVTLSMLQRRSFDLDLQLMHLNFMQKLVAFQPLIGVIFATPSNLGEICSSNKLVIFKQNQLYYYTKSHAISYIGNTTSIKKKHLKKKNKIK